MKVRIWHAFGTSKVYDAYFLLIVTIILEAPCFICYMAQVCRLACLCETPVCFIEMQAAAVSFSWYYYLFMSWAPGCLETWM